MVNNLSSGVFRAVKNLRRMNKVSLSELSEGTGVSVARLKRLEALEPVACGHVTANELERICGYFHLTVYAVLADLSPLEESYLKKKNP